MNHIATRFAICSKNPSSSKIGGREDTLTKDYVINQSLIKDPGDYKI